MAKYDVTMSCGHVQTVQLFGKMADRDKKIAWLENHGICAECAKAEKEDEQAEAKEKAAEKAIADNLPDIKGTEKQVNWALTIRAKMLAEVDKKIADNKDRMDADKLATAELQAKAIKKVVANKFTEARFWIDNRDSFLQKIIKDNNLAEEIKAEIANLQAAETAETENVTTTEEVTAENSAEVEKLEKKLASLKLFPLNTDEYMQACVYSIKKHYACIAKAEEDMWKFQLEKEKYEREVAELENKIANQRIIDAIDNIGGSADAVDASVAAMIELNAANFTAIFNDVENNFTTANLLNAANDFTAANLLDAVNAQVGTAVENVVSFEIQNFAADVNIAEGVATIDTLISGTVIPVIDETAAIDSKVNRLRAEYADLEAQICELRKKQLAISREFSDLTYENESEVSQRLHAPALAKNLFEHGLMIYPQKGEWRRDYIWVENDIEWQELKIGTAKSVDGGYKFVTNDVDGYEKEEIAVYSTLTQFKVVAEKFMAAIERGDKTFTFPADIPPATELPDSDAEIAKQIWF